MGPFLHILLQLAVAFAIGLAALLATYPIYLLLKT
jgi:hypothetical protein